jgi:hypothetical protein
MKKKTLRENDEIIRRKRDVWLTGFRFVISTPVERDALIKRYTEQSWTSKEDLLPSSLHFDSDAGCGVIRILNHIEAPRPLCYRVSKNEIDMVNESDARIVMQRAESGRTCCNVRRLLVIIKGNAKLLHELQVQGDDALILGEAEFHAWSSLLVNLPSSSLA